MYYMDWRITVIFRPTTHGLFFQEDVLSVDKADDVENINQTERQPDDQDRPEHRSSTATASIFFGSAIPPFSSPLWFSTSAEAAVGRSRRNAGPSRQGWRPD